MTNYEKSKNYLDVYDRVLGIFKINNDNYFKRTQILMLVIQSALFISFTSTWGDDIKWALLGLISFLGILSAYAWFVSITRQGDYLEFCRCYLRNIEYRLVELGIPLEYFKNESKVFYHSDPVHFKWSNDDFPHEVGRKVKGRMIGIERWIACVLFIFWVFIFVLFILYGTEIPFPFRDSIKSGLKSIIVL